MIRKFVVVVAMVVMLLVGSSANSASFQGLGDLDGGGFKSYVHGISADGSVVVGQSESASGDEAFRWENGVMTGLGDLPGGDFWSRAYAASVDGSVIVGVSESFSGKEGFHWEGGTMIGLGDLSGGDFRCFATGVSANGSVVAGMGSSASGHEAFRWQNDVMVGLGDLIGGGFSSTAYGISADGSVVVGKGSPEDPYPYAAEAFRWENGVMTGLGDLAGGNFHSMAYGVSADGLVVVGFGTSAFGVEAFRWENDVMIGLGDLAGWSFYSEAWDVSADGAVVVGGSKSASGWEAFIWDADNGMRSLRAVLQNEYSLDLTGWTLTVARGISDNGLTIAGDGINPEGNQECWVGEISQPEPPEEGPYISSIEPSSGAPGIDVTIKGFGFPAFPMVNFGEKLIPVPWGSWSENEVVVKVPSGKGVVDVSLGTITGVVLSNSVKFTYKDPVIHYIDPPSGRAGEKVIISGKDFGYKDSSPFFWVKFGKTTSVTTLSWTDTEIVAKAPLDFGTGISDKLMFLRVISYVGLGLTAPLSEVIIKIIMDLLDDLLSEGVRIPEGEGKIEVDVRVITPTEKESNAKIFTFHVPKIIHALLRSPGELRVHDSQGNVTGLVDGEIKEEIAYSYCADNNILIAYPIGSYTYEVVGTGYGPYGLSIISASDGEEITFEAAEIPTSPGARHVYAVDWQALSAGEEGVILKIDKNGDGFFEQMAIADNELTGEEFALQAETVIDFDPDTLNLNSEGKFATVYIELPDDFDVSDIDLFSLTLNELVPPLPKPIEIGDYDNDGRNDLMVKFDLQELIEVLEPGEQIIDLTGRLWDGRPLAGFDFIRVIHESQE